MRSMKTTAIVVARAFGASLGETMAQSPAATTAPKFHQWAMTPFRGPGHWPDADMLPLGNVRVWQEKDNWTQLTEDEQITLMTLWCIARSPLIMGGNMPKNDAFTLSLMTNDEVIAVNQQSTNNRQVFISLADLGLSGPCKVRDLWAREDLDAVETTISATINSHGVVLCGVQSMN
jgi:alpha-galactosidase